MEAFVFVAIVFAGLLAWCTAVRMQPMRYRKRTALTGDERDFYFRLRSALPECHVWPQVAVSALIEAAGMGKSRQRAVRALGGKRVGFAVFDDNMELLAVVELAHRSWPRRSERAQEAGFASAGVRTVRFRAKRLPSEEKIRSSIFERRSARQGVGVRLRMEKELEFRKTPWPNSMDAHT